MTTAVIDELAEDPGVTGYTIDVASDDGIVTLSGVANNLLANERAVRVARTVKGVKAVNDEVEVAETRRSDQAIATDVKAALEYDPATSAMKIKIGVRAAVVTLAGTVESWQEAQLAQTIASGIRGVRAVDNNLNINWASQRSDEEIKEEIVSRIQWDSVDNDLKVEAGPIYYRP